jgi:uncharacterized membrane protein YeiH
MQNALRMNPMCLGSFLNPVRVGIAAVGGSSLRGVAILWNKAPTCLSFKLYATHSMLLCCPITHLDHNDMLNVIFSATHSMLLCCLITCLDHNDMLNVIFSATHRMLLCCLITCLDHNDIIFSQVHHVKGHGIRVL